MILRVIIWVQSSLPSAPSSPGQAPVQQLEGSVHFGAVGDFSGVQTPDSSLAERVSVITLALLHYHQGGCLQSDNL